MSTENRAIAKWLAKTYLPLWLLSSVLVFAAVYTAAWVMYGTNLPNRPRQAHTHSEVSLIANRVDEYRKFHNELPADLTDEAFFKTVPDFDAQRGPLDGWGHPLYYEVKDGEYLVYSLGRDSQPGGVGLDADMYSNNRDESSLMPTFAQFITTRDKGEIVGSNVFMWAGASSMLSLVFLVAAFVRERDSYTRAGRIKMLGITLLCSGVVAFFLIQLHFRSGH